jgi:hypothetical protein
MVDTQHRDKGDSSTLSDQLTTVLEELKLMKAEKEREHDSSRRINRGRSGSGERSENGEGRNDWDRDRDRDRDRERDREKDSGSDSDGSRYRNSSGDDSNSRSDRKDRSRGHNLSRGTHRKRRREAEDALIQMDVQAMQLELDSMRSDIQRSAYLRQAHSVTPGASRRDLITPIRPYDGDHDISAVSVRRELDATERALQAATRRADSCADELRYKSEEVARLTELLEDSKAENKRVTKELRTVKDQIEYNNKQDLSSHHRLELDRLRADAAALHDKVNQLLNDQQRMLQGHRSEAESWKNEREHMSTQMASMLRLKSSSLDILTLQVLSNIAD